MKFPGLTPITGMALVLGAAGANADPLLYVISGSATGDGQSFRKRQARRGEC